MVVFVRRASVNTYGGEGMEVLTEMQDTIRRPSLARIESTDESTETEMNSCNTLDKDAKSCLIQPQHNYDEVFRTNMQITEGNSLLCDAEGNDDDEDNDSLDLNFESSSQDSLNDSFDSWNDSYTRYGADSLDFQILGANSVLAESHVLTPPLMESLSSFLPYSKSGENYLLKYSLERDGASMHTFLKQAKGVQYSILAIETADGEVFGCFTGQAWRKNWNYFGSGESFLWRMRQSQMDTGIDVHPYTGENDFVQLCTQDRLAVGGGVPTEETENDDTAKGYDWGFGLAIDSDLLEGTSSPCVTFGSPSLSKVHSDGSSFEIVNLELWTLTPFSTSEEAEKFTDRMSSMRE